MVGRHRAIPAKVTRIQPGKGASKKHIGYTTTKLTTRAFSDTGKKTTLTKFAPAIFTSGGVHHDARARYTYSTGKMGKVQRLPTGGTYRPVVEYAGWKQSGVTRMPAGYVAGQLSKKKGRR